MAWNYVNIVIPFIILELPERKKTQLRCHVCVNYQHNSNVKPTYGFKTCYSNGVGEWGGRGGGGCWWFEEVIPKCVA